MILRHLIIIAAAIIFILADIISEQLKTRVASNIAPDKQLHNSIAKIEYAQDEKKEAAGDNFTVASKVQVKSPTPAIIKTAATDKNTSHLIFNVTDNDSGNPLNEVKIRGRVTLAAKPERSQEIRQIIINDTTNDRGEMEDYHTILNHAGTMELVMFKEGYETKMAEMKFDNIDQKSSFSFAMKKLA